MDKIEIDNYFENINIQNEKKEKQNLNTMDIFASQNDNQNNKEENDKIKKDNSNNKEENEDNIMIIEEEQKKSENNNINKDIQDIMIIEEKEEPKNVIEITNDKDSDIKVKEKKTKNKEKKHKNSNKNNKNSNNNFDEKTNIEDNESKKEQKGKKRVRGPNKCYRIIDEFFSDKKRTKKIDDTNNDFQKQNSNKINDEQTNNEDNKNRRSKKRTKIIEMSEKFDEFLNFVNEKVNKNYYDNFAFPIINNYKEFYIEKEKEFKKKKKNIKEDNNNNINIDENLEKRKKSYGLENFLEIPEIVNEFVKHIYNKNLFASDESKIEMIEIIFIFCTWLKQYHYSSYSIEYLIKSEEEENRK